MIEQLISWDTEAFKSIHLGMANNFFDHFMPLVRNKYSWIPLYIIFLVFAIRKFKLQSIILIAGLVLTVLLADQFSATWVKESIERLRPCNDPGLKNLIRPLVPCGSGYSFISAHATNHFAIAVFFSWFFRQLNHWVGFNYIFYLWAASIAFAQVYVGVHFPLDVIIGALAGLLIGHLMLYLTRLSIKT